MSTRSMTAVLAAAALAALCGASTASAAPVADRASAKVAEATSGVRTVAVVENEDDGGTCSRSRRRLWVEGEGWVVRRITTCR